MKNILLFGAGRSATSLIDYLCEHVKKQHWNITLVDADLELAKAKLAPHDVGTPVALDVTNDAERRPLIESADLVISMMPAFLHIIIARDCIEFEKHLLTASYISPELEALRPEIEKRGLIFMNEIGLDPGIDHMSAVQTIDEIQAEGGKILGFESYTGGVIAPESDNNPWRYKFTWNPRNVVLAGQGTAKYIKEGEYKYIPYQRLFSSFRKIEIPNFEAMEGYPNRDSLKYRDTYRLGDIPTMVRGTLRYAGFASAWQLLVTLGLTDDTIQLDESDQLTYRTFFEAFLPADIQGSTTRERAANFFNLSTDDSRIEKLAWTGLFSDEPITLKRATPAQILETLLLKKWTLATEDKDLIVMHHEFDYELDGIRRLKTATLMEKGEDSEDTAMAKLVGLPLAIFARMVMEGQVSLTGLLLPNMKSVYEPVLEELATLGVRFEEYETELA